MRKRIGRIVIAICCVIAVGMCVYLLSEIMDLGSEKEAQVVEQNEPQVTVIPETTVPPVDTSGAEEVVAEPTPEALVPIPTVFDPENTITNADGEEYLYEVSVTEVRKKGKRALVIGTARVPVNPLGTEEQREEFAEGRVTVLGHTWIVKSAEVDEYSMPLFYLYENEQSTEYSYSMQEDMPLLNYPGYYFADRKGERVYEEVGQVALWIEQKDFIDNGGKKAYKKFVNGQDWLGKWTPIEVERNEATVVQP